MCFTATEQVILTYLSYMSVEDYEDDAIEGAACGLTQALPVHALHVINSVLANK